MQEEYWASGDTRFAPPNLLWFPAALEFIAHLSPVPPVWGDLGLIPLEWTGWRRGLWWKSDSLWLFKWKFICKCALKYWFIFNWLSKWARRRPVLGYVLIQWQESHPRSVNNCVLAHSSSVSSLSADHTQTRPHRSITSTPLNHTSLCRVQLPYSASSLYPLLTMPTSACFSKECVPRARLSQLLLCPHYSACFVSGTLKLQCTWPS